MKDSEILLLKGWDSSYNVKTPMCTPHTSFNLQGQNIKKNPRDSIEARIFIVLKIIEQVKKCSWLLNAQPDV